MSSSLIINPGFFNDLTNPSKSISASSRVRSSHEEQYVYKTDITQDVIDAILAGRTQITRRVEFFEYDGVTPWNPTLTPRVLSGSIAISYGSENRRSLDLVLNNADRAIDHNPDGGLWYDKIIRVYRGVKYSQLNLTPRVGVLGQNETDIDSIGPFLNVLGLTDVDYLSDSSLTAALEYDILVAYSQSADFSPEVSSVMNQAYNAGKSVLSLSAFATPSTVPLIDALVAVPDYDSTWEIAPPGTDTPVSSKFLSYSRTVDSGNQVSDLSAGTFDAVQTSSQPHAAFYTQNSQNGRWFHYQVPLATPFYAHLDASNQEEKNLIHAAVGWLFNYKRNIFFETQVGEFQIDRISESNFPEQISISGRDYSKRLDLAKFLAPTTYPAGQSLNTVIQAIAVMGGITRLSITTQDTPLLADAPFDKGTSMVEALSTLATSYNFEWFFDRTGYFVTRQFLDPATSPSDTTIETGSNLISYEKISDDTEMYNIIVVTGQNADGDSVYSGSATNWNADSPTSIQRVGNRPYFEDSSLFTSDDACVQRARSLLQVKALEAYELDFSALVFPWLDVGEIIEFFDPNRLPDTFQYRFLLTDITIPLDLSPMSGTGKRVGLVYG